MSHFYGTLQGARGEATRCGSRASGVTATAASWRGAVQVRVFVNQNGQDAFEVEQIPWKGHGDRLTLASGVFDSGSGKGG